MKEQLYAIPVNDAFDADCECPVCFMYNKLQGDAIDFVMGASYMEDDVRMETDQIGFCANYRVIVYLLRRYLSASMAAWQPEPAAEIAWR